MPIDLGFTYCAYCGEEFPADAPNGAEHIGVHIRTCAKHPMRDLERELQAWRYRAITAGHYIRVLQAPEVSEGVTPGIIGECDAAYRSAVRDCERIAGKRH